MSKDKVNVMVQYVLVAMFGQCRGSEMYMLYKFIIL